MSPLQRRRPKGWSNVSRPYKILVADRNPHVRRFLSRELSAAGFQVEAAASAKRLMEALGDEAGPDLLVVDPDLPDAESPALLAQICERWPAVPVVIHTFFCELTEQPQNLAWTAACVEKNANSSDMLIREVRRLLKTPVSSSPT